MPSVRATALASMLLTLNACGGSGDAAGPSGTVGGFTVSISGAAPSIVQGGTGTITASIGRTGSFSQTVQLTVEGLPSGVTASFSPASISNGTASTTLTIQVAAQVAPGSYALVVRGSASGLTDQTATVGFTVTAAPAAPAIAIVATPAQLSVAPGGSVSTTIAITRTNFTGTAVIAVQSGLPTGVTAVNSPSGPVTGTSVQVTFDVGAAVAPGVYSIVLQGAGFQATSGTTSVTLTVTGPSGAVTLTAAPAALSIQQGAQASTAITLTRTNYTGAVSLSVTGAVTGLTTSVAPTSTTGNSATLSVAAGNGATPGTYPLTVTASGSGVPTTQLTVSVTVTAVSSGGNITWRFCAATGVPVWFAYQNGGASSAWTSAGAVGTSYSFTIGSQGAVAYVFQNATNSYTTNIVYGSLAELQSQASAACGTSALAGKTVTGSVTGFTSASDFVQVSMGSQFASPSPTQAFPTFQIAGVLDGPRDLIGTRSAVNGGLVLNRLFIKRNLNPANLGSVGVVDFSAGDSFAPESRTLTMTNVQAGETVLTSNTWYTANSSFGSLGSATAASATSYRQAIVPASRTVAGDVQMLAVSAATITGSAVTHIRSMAIINRDPVDQSVAFGGFLNTATISVASTAPYARLRAQLTRQAEYNDWYTANFAQSSGATERAMSVTMSSSYLNGAASFDATLPDLSAAAGWQNTWGLATGVTTNWNVSATGWIALNGAMLDGARWRTAQRQGSIVP